MTTAGSPSDEVDRTILVSGGAGRWVSSGGPASGAQFVDVATDGRGLPIIIPHPDTAPADGGGHYYRRQSSAGPSDLPAEPGWMEWTGTQASGGNGWVNIG